MLYPHIFGWWEPTHVYKPGCRNVKEEKIQIHQAKQTENDASGPMWEEIVIS